MRVLCSNIKKKIHTLSFIYTGAFVVWCATHWGATDLNIKALSGALQPWKGRGIHLNEHEMQPGIKDRVLFLHQVAPNS